MVASWDGPMPRDLATTPARRRCPAPAHRLGVGRSSHHPCGRLGSPSNGSRPESLRIGGSAVTPHQRAMVAALDLARCDLCHVRCGDVASDRILPRAVAGPWNPCTRTVAVGAVRPHTAASGCATRTSPMMRRHPRHHSGCEPFETSPAGSIRQRLSQTLRSHARRSGLIRLRRVSHALFDELPGDGGARRHGDASPADPGAARRVPTGRQQSRAAVRVDPRRSGRGAVRPPGRGR